MEKVRKPLGELVAVLKGALVKRVPNPNRVRPTAQTEVTLPQGGMIKVGSTMKKSRSAGFLVGALSSPDLSAEGAGMNGESLSLSCLSVCVRWPFSCVRLIDTYPTPPPHHYHHRQAPPRSNWTACVPRRRS